MQICCGIVLGARSPAGVSACLACLARVAANWVAAAPFGQSPDWLCNRSDCDREGRKGVGADRCESSFRRQKSTQLGDLSQLFFYTLARVIFTFVWSLFGYLEDISKSIKFIYAESASTGELKLDLVSKVCPSICPSICRSIYPSISPSICPFICPSICPCICPSICLSIRLSVCLSICLSVCLVISLRV